MKWFTLCLVMCLFATRGHCKLTYVWGDALEDMDTLDQDGNPYPIETIQRMFSDSGRKGRTMFSTMNPETVQRILLEKTNRANTGVEYLSPAPQGRSMRLSLQTNGLSEEIAARVRVPLSSTPFPSSTPSGDLCQETTPSRLCKTTLNTTAPMYGVSLTSGQPVTIVQKFPDLLQQVIFEVCKTDECDVLHGTCIQTYVPYLFLVIPLGPVTLTGQDYVLVESGCVCQPKFAASPLPPFPPDVTVPAT